MKNWFLIAETDPVTPATIQNQVLWNNSKILIGHKPISKCFNVDFVGDLYDPSGNLLSWRTFSEIHACPQTLAFKYIQIIHAIPQAWKNIISSNKQDFCASNGTLRDQHFLYMSRVISMDRLSSKLLYTYFLSKIKKSATSEATISKKFENTVFIWPRIHLVARYATVDSYTRMFHFKCTHNILYLNRVLYSMGLADSRLCSYCSAFDETVPHLFFDCQGTKDLWAQIQVRLACLNLPDITPESAYIGLPADNLALIQHLHLIFRICLYKGREKKTCNFQYFSNKVKQVRKIETCCTSSDPRKKIANYNKWSRIPESF